MIKLTWFVLLIKYEKVISKKQHKFQDKYEYILTHILTTLFLHDVIDEHKNGIPFNGLQAKMKDVIVENHI